MKILIIKFGALGDVVRTSYFAKSLKETYKHVEIYWLTSEASASLIRFNPFIDVISSNHSNFISTEFDKVYSLDDEREIAALVSDLTYENLIGAYVCSDESVKYTSDCNVWFDMGLLSRFGKKVADDLKKENKKTHCEIFSGIFNVINTSPQFYNSSWKEAFWAQYVRDHAHDNLCVGINAFAGKRWHSKALQRSELKKLILSLHRAELEGKKITIFLLGAGSDAAANAEIAKELGITTNLVVADTTCDVLNFAALINSLDLLISSDSLALHMSIGQKVKTICFFAPTSAAEIENYPYIKKLTSDATDYCSYRPDADNFRITAKKLMVEVELFLTNK